MVVVGVAVGVGVVVGGVVEVGVVVVVAVGVGVEVGVVVAVAVARPHPSGDTIFSGRTYLSKSSGFTRPSSAAACLSVMFL